mmetsp:Transcript_8537/g.31266  ORF Transcript_8537/g.31266 Transcript_8537/m.31266 type:complete len:95 (-) Transcript_8537:455-739(-)
MDGGAYPVDAGITSNDFVHWIDHDYFIVLIHRILVQPIGIEHTKSTTTPSSAFFRNGSQVASELELLDSLMNRLAIANSLKTFEISDSRVKVES